ncbi:unnamed protein product, partial [Ectocarpus fasciculatus]
QLRPRHTIAPSPTTRTSEHHVKVDSREHSGPDTSIRNPRPQIKMPPCTTTFVTCPDGWTSTTVARPISHSADVKRRRKAEKSKKDRARKQLRKHEANVWINQAITTPRVKNNHTS